MLSRENKSFVNVFIITDGEINDRDLVIDKIKKYKKCNIKFFTTTYNSFVATRLCDELAKGSCRKFHINCSDFDGSEKIKKILIDQLDLSRKDSYCYDIKVHIDDDVTILKEPYSTSNYVYKIVTKTRADKKLDKIKLTYVNSSTLEISSHIVACNISKDNEIIKKIFVKSMIDSLEKGNIHSEYDIINLSIDNNILSSKTSFVIVNDDL